MIHDAHVKAWVKREKKRAYLAERRRQRAEAEGRELRAYRANGPSTGQHKVHYKRMQRLRVAAAQGRLINARASRFDAHVLAWTAARADHRQSVMDAHVKRFGQVQAARRKWMSMKDRPSTRDGRIRRRRDERERLDDRYIVRLLTGSRMGAEQIASLPPVLIAAKREQLRLERYINQLEGH